MKKPIVQWRQPAETPDVEKFKHKLFWIAVQTQWSEDQAPKILVYPAHYINKPDERDENGDSLDPDPWFDSEGNDYCTVGWHLQYDHPDYNGFYQAITFSPQNVLLAWAEYEEPEYPAPHCSQAMADVMAERQRQISVEGWTPEHDDQHSSYQLSQAAACYAVQVSNNAYVAEYSGCLKRYQRSPVDFSWPWDDKWWKPKTPRQDLVRAAALILAEIERLDRKGGAA